ncbi:MAG: tetratricopeptide repeat protein [Thiobacillus sp.]|nr:tetratricopeptide repeat protein [Thiobacillus sp.]
MHSKWERRVIPKWRASSVTADLPESRPTTVRTNKLLISHPNTDLLERLIAQWRAEGEIGVAADILNFSHLPESLPLIRDVAEEVLRRQRGVPVPLLDAAKHVAGFAAAEETLPVGMDHLQQYYYQVAARLKGRLRENPRNSIALVDLALVYAALGQDKKARDAMLQAVSLCPNNRFVLRSAVRLLIHVDDAERALRLLGNSGRVLVDPWLLAPLISTTAILGKPQKYLKKAKLLFTSETLHPTHLSELGGALATVQIIDGDIKGAKRTFNAALVSPNDNTVAQAMWAAENFSIQITPQEEWFNNKYSCEGRYYQRYSDADFEGAMGAAVHWFRDEPFSTRPMKAACFISGLLGKNEESERFALKGLRLNKDDTELRNNLIFALASQNKVDAAVNQLQDLILDERRSNGRVSAHSLANIGMLMYREGNFNEAETFYRRAIDDFGKSGNTFSRALASAFMAREALLANAPNVSRLIEEARKVNKDAACAAGEKVLNCLGSDGPVAEKVQKKSEQRVTYDSSRNILFVSKRNPFNN